MSEFVKFLNKGFHVSLTGHEIQLWGIRKNKDAELKGVSFHFPDEWDAFNPNRFADEDYNLPTSFRLDCAWKLANEAEVPLFWVGEHNANWRNLKGTAEIGVIMQEDNRYKSETKNVDIDPDSGTTITSEMANLLQEIMETSLAYPETEKQKNRRITPIQKWVRNNMPEKYIVIDIDLLVGDKDGDPQGLVEIRRSKWANYNEGGEPIYDWWPWFSDRRNYYLLADTAERSGCDPILIHHLPEQLTEESNIGYYTNLAFREFENDKIKYQYDSYPNEEKSRQWLKFDVEYLHTSEAVNRLKQLQG